MKKALSILFGFIMGLMMHTYAQPVKLQSPDGKLELSFELRDGVPYYALSRAGTPMVLPSRLGFIMEWRDDMKDHFVLKDTQYGTFDETWEPVWGEESKIRNHYNEMLVTLEQPIGSVASMDHSTETKATVMQVRFRLYDDGLGFRYEFPIENALTTRHGGSLATWTLRNTTTPSQGCRRSATYGKRATKMAAGLGLRSPTPAYRPPCK